MSDYLVYMLQKDNCVLIDPVFDSVVESLAKIFELSISLAKELRAIFRAAVAIVRQP